MKKIRFYFEYLFLKLLANTLRLLSRCAMLFLGARAGDFIYYCVPIRRKLTISQLNQAFQEKSQVEIKRIARDVYRSLAMNTFEHLCLSYLSKEELIDTVELHNAELLDKAFARGKGIIFVGGHFGNWEYMGGAVSSKGYPVGYVVASITNPYIDRMVNDHRKSVGIDILEKGMSMRGILQTQRNNGSLAMLMDQDAGRSGAFVNYFGRLCSAPKGPVLFVLKTGAALLYVSSARQPDGTLRAVFKEVEVNYDAGPTKENIHDIMQRSTTMLENSVREYPGQWFWMHRRWKTPSPQDSSGREKITI
ncbi:MAG: lysophospholipid acyltransferase family protein [Desulfocapsaceae bacterium]|nr:lysophospholipid acyltransferase family protein [Desulfocapsaceae bacterium]